TETPTSFGSTQASTTGTDSVNGLKIGTLETSWIINPKSFATAKFYNFKNPGTGTASNTATVVPNFTKGTHLDINNLPSLGRFIVPTPVNATQTAFVQPYITKYGYLCPTDAAQAKALGCTPGVISGGGTLGFGQFSRDDDSFYRTAAQGAYNYTLGTNVTHDLHIGYQHYKDSEDRFQLSNGWGLISIPGNAGADATCPASACGVVTPAFFVAQVSQQGATGVPTIHSEIVSQNAEFNDTIHMNNWSFNVGFLDSQDTLYGQGLAKANNVAGFVSSPGTKYLMHRFSWSDMVQPRLSGTWAYNGRDTVWTSFARYMPPANSDARAASWDRNLVAQLKVYFDKDGNEIGIAPNASSSGKWWQDGIKHPEIKEFMAGTSRQMGPRWTARLYSRYRKGAHYLEDTQNTARNDFQAPAGIPRDPYVPNLGTVATPGTIRNAFGSGSSYVIANLDGAFTKYYEATAESEWHGDKLTVNGSYTWSHYYGNFDQDDSSFNSANDAAVFIGSSNIGDGAGRQMWDNKLGRLRGDRPAAFKVFGAYSLMWNATVGFYAIAQSGQPWETHSFQPYAALTTSTSNTDRYSEPAGIHRAPSHSQLDLNYTQDLPFLKRYRGALTLYVFNVSNKQTGYNIQPNFNAAGYGKPISFYDPRRAELTARFIF
ncbi:MAG: hypothetical protein QOF63_834, partial [Thermoanaerobaculia bacterium]|nr:hypothetical protein [Thermoanaerobaculia bacterium]